MGGIIVARHRVEALKAVSTDLKAVENRCDTVMVLVIPVTLTMLLRYFPKIHAKAMDS